MQKFRIGGMHTRRRFGWSIVSCGCGLLGLPHLSIQAAEERPKLQITNGGPNPVQVYWLKPEGGRVDNGIIKPSADTVITTTIGHRFVVVDEVAQREQEVVSKVRIQAARYEPDSKDGVPAFYTQRVLAQGFPVVGSAKVNPYALKEAVFIVNAMLANRPDVRQAMIDSGARLCVMAHDEYTTELPEHARLGTVSGFERLPARDYWDARARGLGGSATDPVCSCGEENLLAYKGDPYSQESILIHEFAHLIHHRGLANVDATFDDRVRAAYDSAIKAGLWKGKYASVNRWEYFAEGVQSWFDDNRENDHDHNHVNTRAELVEYDPGLAALCREVFGNTELKYTKPQTRLTGHLEGYDPSTAPKFVWPERLDAARKTIAESVQNRLKRD